ncbi:unnamed protein product, partial [Effrenium voratum]
MAGLELATLAARPKAWAEKLSNQSKIDQPLKTFVNTGSLTELAEGVANLNAARLAPQKKRTFADSSDDETKQACGNESGEESASGCSQPAGPVSGTNAILTLEDEEEEASDEEGGAPDVRLWRDLTQQLKEFAHLADTGSRLCAGAMAGLELATLAARPKAWAEKLSNQSKVDRPLKTFVNTGSLTELAEGVANLNAARLTPQQKRTFADSSDAEKKQACGNESGEESASGCSQPAGPVSEESCSEDKRSKKKRKEKKSKDGRKRDKAILTLEDDEEEASDEEGGAPDVHLSWPAADVNFFAKELEGMMTKQDKKKERLPLSAL